MANNASNNNNAPKQTAVKQKKLLLAGLFTDAPVRVEPEEPQKVLVAGLAQARPKKDYPDTFFGRAFKVFKGEFGLMVKSSLFFMLFTIPFVIIIAWFAGYFEDLVLGGAFNFMGDIGTGFPGGGDSLAVSVARLYWDVKEPVFAMVAATLILGGLGASGAFYCAKRCYFQDYYSRFVRTYWMGFAKYWWKFLLTAAVEVLIGLAMATSVLYLLQQQSLGTAGAGAYCAVVFSFIFGAPLMLIPMVMLSLYTTYELTFVQTFKNALVIIVNNPVTVSLVAILSAAPLLLCLINTIFAIIIYVAMLVAGCSLMELCWIAMASRGMTKCHLRKLDADKQKQQELRQQARKESKANRQQNNAPAKKQAPKPYQNPKKKKKKN